MLNNKYDLAGQYLDMANSGTLTEEEKNRKLGYINNALSIDGQQQLQQRKNAAMTALMGSDWNQPGGGGLASAIGGNSGHSPYTSLFGPNNNFGSSSSGGSKMFQPSMGFAEGGLVPPPQYLAQGGQAMPFTGPRETLADDKTIHQDPVFQQAQRWASNNAMQDMRMQRDGMSSTAQELSATRRIDDQQWGNRLADRGIGYEIIPYGKGFRTRPQRFALPPVNEHGQYFAQGGVVPQDRRYTQEEYNQALRGPERVDTAVGSLPRYPQQGALQRDMNTGLDIATGLLGGNLARQGVRLAKGAIPWFKNIYVKQGADMAANAAQEYGEPQYKASGGVVEPRYGMRDNMTYKGQGFYGDVGSNGRAVTEYSTGMPMPKNGLPLGPAPAPLYPQSLRSLGGAYMDVPAVVPGLPNDTRRALINEASGNGQMTGDQARESDLNAFEHATNRMWQGKKPFAQNNDPIVQYRATGGVVGMHPGQPKGTDTVPAWLTPGEAVLTPQATQAIGGKPVVDILNSIGKGGLYTSAQQRGLPPVRGR